MDLEKLKDAVEQAWCRETAYSGSRERWHDGNKAIGQCAVTALVVQDFLGGKIAYGFMPEAGMNHYWNQIGGSRVDFTWKQFEDEFQLPGIEDFRTRESLLENPETKERYELLKGRVQDALKPPEDLITPEDPSS